MAKPILTAARVRELVHYDPETGVFFRRIAVGKKSKPGDVLTAKNSNGYSRFSIDGQRIYAHRLAWIYMTGEWPVNEIDHMDCDPSNNRFSNLRDVTRVVNAQNVRRAMHDNASGLLGTCKHDSGWIAQIRVGKRNVHLGLFKTPEEAHEKYLTAKRELHQGNTL